MDSYFQGPLQQVDLNAKRHAIGVVGKLIKPGAAVESRGGVKIGQSGAPAMIVIRRSFLSGGDVQTSSIMPTTATIIPVSDRRDLVPSLILTAILLPRAAGATDGQRSRNLHALRSHRTNTILSFSKAVTTIFAKLLKEYVVIDYPELRTDQLADSARQRASAT